MSWMRSKSACCATHEYIATSLLDEEYKGLHISYSSASSSYRPFSKVLLYQKFPGFRFMCSLPAFRLQNIFTKKRNTISQCRFPHCRILYHGYVRKMFICATHELVTMSCMAYIKLLELSLFPTFFFYVRLSRASYGPKFIGRAYMFRKRKPTVQWLRAPFSRLVNLNSRLSITTCPLRRFSGLPLHVLKYEPRQWNVFSPGPSKKPKETWSMLLGATPKSQTIVNFNSEISMFRASLVSSKKD
jgi:hypothetical protein